MRIRRLLPGIAALVLTLMISANCLSVTQSTRSDDERYSSVAGTVVDRNGAIVTGVKITLISDQNGFQRQTATNDQGAFSIVLVPPGVYALTAEMRGFAIILVKGLVTQPDRESRVEIELQPRAVAEMITINARENRVDSSDATLKYSISPQEAAAYPVIGTAGGRSLLDTSLFLPGISPNTAVGLRGEGLVINGTRPLSNVFSIDGGDNNDYELGIAASPLPNPDALQEVIIVTNSSKADIGGAAGGIFNAVIKSGTNDLHGGLRYLFSDDALSARGFYDRTRRPYQVVTFGAQLGGPIRLPPLYRGKNRSHFFLDYEAIRQSSDSPFNVQVLTERERNGDFSDLPAYDPTKPGYLHQPLDPSTRQPFPGGKIPSNRIDPIASYYIGHFIPRPNCGHHFSLQPDIDDDLYCGAFRNDQSNRQFTTRFDHRVGANDSFSASYLFDSNDANRLKLSYYPLPLGGDLLRSRTNTLVLRETHTLSPSTVNETTATVVRSVLSDRANRPGFTGLRPADAGFTGITPQTDSFPSLPAVRIASPMMQQWVSLDVPSYLNQEYDDKLSWAVKDDFSHVRGVHTLGFGAGVRGLAYDKAIPNNNGAFSFGDYSYGGTDNAIANFLLGVPNDYEQTTGSRQYQRQRALFLYAMDDWRLLSNLTVNLGVRYELVPPVVDKLDQVSVYRPGQKSLRFPNAPAGQLFVGDPDPVLGTVPRGGYPADVNNLAPRLGIAYSPEPKSQALRSIFGEGKTSFRAGAGVFYSPPYGLSLSQFAYVAPFSVAATFPGRNGTFADPFANAHNPFPLKPGDGLGEGLTYLNTFDPTLRSGDVYHYNLTLQRELPGAMLFEIGYVGRKSFKLERERNLNPPLGVEQVFSSLLTQESSGRAEYDSMQVRLSRRFDRGFLVDASYTLAKSLDNGSGPYSQRSPLGPLGFPPDARTSRPDDLRWARSDYDRRHNFAVMYVYSLPHLPLAPWGEALCDGWQIAGITQLRSGIPLPYWYGRGIGRNVVDGPGFNLTSVSVTKRTRLFETHEIEMRADVINLFNHPNLAAAQAEYSGSDDPFKITNTGRRIQVALRYRF